MSMLLTVAGGSGDSRQTDPLLHSRSISFRWARYILEN
jgi:hypothetical protein